MKPAFLRLVYGAVLIACMQAEAACADSAALNLPKMPHSDKAFVGVGGDRLAPVKAPTLIPYKTPSVPIAISDRDARDRTRPVAAEKIILVGDSTTQVNTGWGGFFCAYRLTSNVACINLARGGRSTFSYRAEGSWAIALNEARSSGYDRIYMLIQFGHNDQPGKPGNSTDLDAEFKKNLEQFVIEARQAGAIPVLITPLARRSFVDYSLQDTLQPWADAAIEVARKLNVPLVDLHATSLALIQAAGPVKSLDWAQTPPPAGFKDFAVQGTSAPQPKPGKIPAIRNNESGLTATLSASFDYTHLGREGAEVFSELVAEGLAQTLPELRHSLIR